MMIAWVNSSRAASSVVLIDDDVDDACRQDSGAEFAQPKRRQRRGHAQGIGGLDQHTIDQKLEFGHHLLL